MGLARDIQMIIIDAWRIARRIDFNFGDSSSLLREIAVYVEVTNRTGTWLDIPIIGHRSDGTGTS